MLIKDREFDVSERWGRMRQWSFKEIKSRIYAGHWFT